MRTIHRAQHQLLVLQVHGRKHIFVVVSPMSGTHVEVNLREVWRVNMLVARAPFFFEDVILQKTANGGAFRQPEWQTGSHQIAHGEKAEFFSDAAMVAALGFFELVQIFVEFLLINEARAINPLHLRIAFLAFPIRARNAH